MDNTVQNRKKNKMIDMFAFVLESLYFYSQTMAKTISEVMTRLTENIHIADLVEEISDKIKDHPVLRFIAVVTTLTCSIPVIMFIAFGIVTAIITFVGFLFVEGTLLAVGGLCMVMVIVSLVMVMSVLAITLGICYIMSLKCVVLYQNFDSSSSLVEDLRPSLMNGIYQIPNSIDDVHQD